VKVRQNLNLNPNPNPNPNPDPFAMTAPHCDGPVRFLRTLRTLMLVHEIRTSAIDDPVARCVCRSVCLSATRLRPAKGAERSEVL